MTISLHCLFLTNLKTIIRRKLNLKELHSYSNIIIIIIIIDKPLSTKLKVRGNIENIIIDVINIINSYDERDGKKQQQNKK